MKYDFHGLTVETTASDPDICLRWSATFASRPVAEGPAQIRFALRRAASVPPTPEGEPDFRQGDLLQYHVHGADVVAHFPRYGQLRLNLTRGEVEGRFVAAALATYGVFEDLVAIGLSPLLRRRGMFLLHAFAASLASPPRPFSRRGAKRTRAGRRGAVLLVGDIGAGKTTTGLSLLHAGWKLLSNDSPVLRDEAEIQVLAYPGLLSAYPDSLLRFPELHVLATTEHPPPAAGRGKVVFAAEDYYPGVWIDRAPAGAIIFPQIESRADHILEPLPAPEVLRLLLPHAVEQWDREMIPAHLALLTKLAQTTPAFRLRLGPDTDSLPAVIAYALSLNTGE